MAFYDELKLIKVLSVRNTRSANNTSFYYYTFGFIKCIHSQQYNIIHDTHYEILENAYIYVFKFNNINSFAEFVQKYKIIKTSEFMKKNVISSKVLKYYIRCDVRNIIDNQTDYIDMYIEKFAIQSLQFYANTKNIIYYHNGTDGLYVDVNNGQLIFVCYDSLHILDSKEINLIEYIITTKTSCSIKILSKIDDENIKFNYGFCMVDGDIYNIHFYYYKFYSHIDKPKQMMCVDLLESYYMKKYNDYDTCVKLLNYHELHMCMQDHISYFCNLLIKSRKYALELLDNFDVHLNEIYAIIQVKNNRSLIVFDALTQRILFINHDMQVFLHCTTKKEYEIAYTIIALKLL